MSTSAGYELGRKRHLRTTTSGLLYNLDRSADFSRTYPTTLLMNPGFSNTTTWYVQGIHNYIIVFGSETKGANQSWSALE
jgi:hypothetical protein